MTPEERSFLTTQLAQKHAWYNTGSRAWSFVYNGSLVLSALLSGMAAGVAKIAFFKDAGHLSDDNIKDIVAGMAALATLLTTTTVGGGAGRKWQANRVSRGRIERLNLTLSDPNADAGKIRAELDDIIAKHDAAIIGTPVK